MEYSRTQKGELEDFPVLRSFPPDTELISETSGAVRAVGAALLQMSRNVLFHHIGLRGQNALWLLFSLTHEFGNAGRAAELIRLATDDPGAFAVGFGASDWAELVAGLRPVVVSRPEAGKSLRRKQISV